ncbi:hypothetical protein BGP78_05670 [Pseudoalteromonas sp. MSK9-3]|uniref:hypothetical protein n=1 Tax=Pseudoalteromonas sp. MSK9-3 TaxID=1897633 RepID=UPI000E6C5D64|nr:hypothetical protein [Pseudoalteromonas sp. MSK9-3]RJE78349.1 hypothetical protein BGP78_05670 [Pseudoalteromonas sp. MSK9-3]
MIKLQLKIAAIALSAASSIFLFGCGSSSDAERPQPPVAELPDPVVPPTAPPLEPMLSLQALKSQTDSYVLTKKQWFNDEGVDCRADVVEQHELCTVESIAFSNGNFDEGRTDNKQTILVLDAGMEFQAILRYRSRVKAFLRYDVQNRAFIESNPSIKVTKVGQQLMSQLDTFTFEDPNQNDAMVPGFIPAKWLEELAQVYTEKVPSDIFNPDTNMIYATHGTMVLGYLAEHIPTAEFVLVDTASFLPFLQHSDLMCTKDSNSLLSYMQSAADSLKANAIDKYGVDFINFSGGYTLEHVTNAFNSKCEGTLQSGEATSLLLAVKPVYDAMFNSTDVLGIQAGIRGVDEVSSVLDTLAYDNRVRVVSYTTVEQDSPLDNDGKVQWRDVFNNFKKHFGGHEHIDLFINFGIKGFNSDVTNSTPKMISDVFGMRYAPEWELHSSWAAPVATSYAVYQQSKLAAADEQWQFQPSDIIRNMIPLECMKKDDDEADVLNFTRDNGACRIQDPLKFKNDEINRLGFFSLLE